MTSHAPAPASRPHPGPLRRLWKSVIRPGARLMGNLRLSAKLLLLVTFMSVPVVLQFAENVSRLRDGHRAALAAQDGARISATVVELHGSLHELRDLSLQVARGDSSLDAMRRQAQQAVAQRLAAVEQAVLASTHLAMQDRWPGLSGAIAPLARDSATPPVTDTFRLVEAARDEASRFLHHTLDRARMSDIGPQARELTDVIGQSGLHVAEAAADLRALGALLLADKGQASLGDRSVAVGMADTLNRELTRLSARLADLEAAGVVLPGSWPDTQQQVRHFASQARRHLLAEAPERSPRQHFDQGSAALAPTQALLRGANDRLQQLVDRHREAVERNIALLAAAYALGSLVLGYLMMAFYVSFHHALRQVLGGMQATAAGDLSHQLPIRGRDELAEISKAFDRMNERLSASTSEIRTRSARVDTAGRQVADGSLQLAQRTDEQAQSVRSTAAAIAQISSAVAQNAQAAREVDALTERLFAQAEAGNAAMAETVVAMDELQNASARVNDVVTVIDDVAFQTGMLALNAAIEAARAGVAGKGFAVVAGEVRQLALRCAESADEIRQLITASGQQVQDSSSKLQHVSVSLDTLVNGVREVSGQLRVIATASTQQSAALEEVESNIASLESITRDNASMVEQSNASAHLLVTQAEALTGSVAEMRLRHGSADEARGLVERALQHVQQVGREQAFQDFNDPHGDWIDRDLFVFCFDRVGTIVVNGINPGRVGNNVNLLDGLRGTHHSDRMWDAADGGGGWVRYELVNPATGQMTVKESYVCQVDDQTLLGCGCYGRTRERGDISQMPGGPVAWSRAREVSTLATA